MNFLIALVLLIAILTVRPGESVEKAPQESELEPGASYVFICEDTMIKGEKACMKTCKHPSPRTSCPNSDKSECSCPKGKLVKMRLVIMGPKYPPIYHYKLWCVEPERC